MLSRKVFCCKRSIGSIYNVVRFTHENAVLSTDQATEVEIKMPWGKVAGKLWGDQAKQPILALHGWQDNAATFDQLAPLLVKYGSILAIDFPGHGLSSWIPPGNPYYESVYLLMVRRIQKQFNWPKVKFLSHSLGAQLTSWYASMFPNDTEFVIALDHVKLLSLPVEVYNEALAHALDKFLDIEQLESQPPSYPEEVLIRKWVAATNGSIDENACRILMTRGMTRTQDGTYRLNRDPRLKILPVHTGFTHSYIQELTARIRCPYLFIRGSNSKLIESEECVNSILNMMRDHCKDFQLKTVAGTHHFHLCNPRGTAEAIIPFLERYNS